MQELEADVGIPQFCVSEMLVEDLETKVWLKNLCNGCCRKRKKFHAEVVQ